jgi:hypothetical protein
VDPTGIWPGQVQTDDLVPDLPPGEEEEHRDDPVHATGGDIGYLHVLCVDQDTGNVTRVRIKRHLWGHRELAIPDREGVGIRGWYSPQHHQT